MKKLIDFDKLQGDYLKAMLKNDGRYNCPMFGGIDEENAYISDGHFMAIIPRDECHVSFRNNQRGIPVDTMKKWIKDRSELLPVTDTGLSRALPTGKKGDTVRMFKQGDEDIWINEKFLKYFPGDYDLYGTDMRNPIYFYFGYRCVGMVLPVNHH